MSEQSTHVNLRSLSRAAPVHHLSGRAAESAGGQLQAARDATARTLAMRLAEYGDAPWIAALIDQQGYPCSGPLIRARLAGLLEREEVLVMVAEQHGEVVGCVVLQFIPDLLSGRETCRICLLLVDQRRTGRMIGSEISAFVAATARERGCARMEVLCPATNASAHGFFKRQGYHSNSILLVNEIE